MSSKALYRLSGIALLVGGALSVASMLLTLVPGNPTDPAYFSSVPYMLGGVLLFVGAALTLMGLPAIIAAQAARSSVLTVIGVACIFGVNLIYNVANTYVDLTIFPELFSNPATHDLAQTGPTPVMSVFFNVGMLLAVVGSLTLGIALLRAGVFPRWIGVVMLLVLPAQILAMLDIPVVESLAPLLGSIVMIGIGSALLRLRHAAVAPAAAPVAVPA